MTESVGYQISGINNQITDDFGADNDLRVVGGGRGWTASTTIRGEVWSAKSTSKLGAAEELYGTIREALSTEQQPEPEAPAKAKANGITMEEVLAALQAGFPALVIGTTDEDEDVEAGPVWEGETLVELVPCNAECMGGKSDLCECRCMGANHGIAGAMFLGRYADSNTALQRRQAIADVRPTVMGIKPCKCGCGETTMRTFRPGHDARYHGLINRQKQAAARGVTLEELPKVIAKERRAAKAAAKAKAA